MYKPFSDFDDEDKQFYANLKKWSLQKISLYLIIYKSA
jgi:hypothetical protein